MSLAGTDNSACYVPRSDTGLDLLNVNFSFGGWFKLQTPVGGGRVMGREGPTAGKVQANIYLDSTDNTIRFYYSVDGTSLAAVTSTGIVHVARASEGVVSNSRITGTLADSVHITGQSSYVRVIGNVITDSGDDGVAVVSYRGDGGVSHHVYARNNTISNNKGGRGMSVVGGADVLYENNKISNQTIGAGMYLSQENSYDTYPIRSVSVQFNTLSNCGNAQKGHTAIMLFTDGTTPNTLVHLYRNDIQGGPVGGIRIFGANTSTVVESNRIQGTSPPLNIATQGVTVIPYTDGPVGAL